MLSIFHKVKNKFIRKWLIVLSSVLLLILIVHISLQFRAVQSFIIETIAESILKEKGLKLKYTNANISIFGSLEINSLEINEIESHKPIFNANYFELGFASYMFSRKFDEITLRDSYLNMESEKTKDITNNDSQEFDFKVERINIENFELRTNVDLLKDTLRVYKLNFFAKDLKITENEIYIDAEELSFYTSHTDTMRWKWRGLLWWEKDKHFKIQDFSLEFGESFANLHSKLSKLGTNKVELKKLNLAKQDVQIITEDMSLGNSIKEIISKIRNIETRNLDFVNCKDSISLKGLLEIDFGFSKIQLKHFNAQLSKKNYQIKGDVINPSGWLTDYFDSKEIKKLDSLNSLLNEDIAFDILLGKKAGNISIKNRFLDLNSKLKKLDNDIYYAETTFDLPNIKFGQNWNLRGIKLLSHANIDFSEKTSLKSIDLQTDSMAIELITPKQTVPILFYGKFVDTLLTSHIYIKNQDSANISNLQIRYLFHKNNKKELTLDAYFSKLDLKTIYKDLYFSGFLKTSIDWDKSGKLSNIEGNIRNVRINRESKRYRIPRFEWSYVYKKSIAKVDVYSPGFWEFYLNMRPRAQKKSNLIQNKQIANYLNLNPKIKKIIQENDINIRSTIYKDLFELWKNETYNADYLNVALDFEDRFLIDVYVDSLRYKDIKIAKLEAYTYGRKNFLQMNMEEIATPFIDIEKLTFDGKIDSQKVVKSTLKFKTKDSTYSKVKMTYSLDEATQNFSLHMDTLRFYHKKEKYRNKRKWDFRYNLQTKKWRSTPIWVINENNKEIYINAQKNNGNVKVELEMSNFMVEDLDKEAVITYKLPFDFRLDYESDSLRDKISGKIFSKTFTLNGVDYNNLETVISYDTLEKKIYMSGEADYGKKKVLDFEIGYLMQKGSYKANIDFEEQPMKFLDPMVGGILDDFFGTITGNILAEGSTNTPLILNANFDVNQGGFLLPYLGVKYIFEPHTKVYLTNNQLHFYNMHFTDSVSHKEGFAHGWATNKDFEDWAINIDIETKDLLIIDKKDEVDYYYGKIFGTGNVKVYGPIESVQVDADIRTSDRTEIVFNVDGGKVKETKSDFIYFKTKSDKNTVDNDIDNQEKANRGFGLDLNVQVTPETEILFSAKSSYGDQMNVKGTGNINLKFLNNNFSIFGNYEIDEGQYIFTLNNYIYKIFNIQKGSGITWDNDLKNGKLDLKAKYQTKVNLKDYLQSNNASSRGTIDILLKLSESIQNPKIDFDLDLPFENDRTRSEFRTYIIDPDERRKQSFAVLTFNSLISNNPNLSLFGDISGTTIGVLSGKFSHYISAMSEKLNVQLLYQNNIDLTSVNNQIIGRNVELELSQKLLNDRITINGNIGLNISERNPSNTYFGGTISYDIFGNQALNLQYTNRPNTNQYFINQQANETVQGIGLNLNYTFGESTK